MLPENFSPIKFIEKVFKKMQIENSPEDIKAKLAKQITIKINQRVIDVIISNFGEREKALYNLNTIDNPEKDPIVALLEVGEGIKGLEDKIQKILDELYEELIIDSERVSKNISK